MFVWQRTRSVIYLRDWFLFFASVILNVWKVNKKKRYINKRKQVHQRKDVVHWLETLIWIVILNKNHLKKKKNFMAVLLYCSIQLKEKSVKATLWLILSKTCTTNETTHTDRRLSPELGPWKSGDHAVRNHVFRRYSTRYCFEKKKKMGCTVFSSVKKKNKTIWTKCSLMNSFL